MNRNLKALGLALAVAFAMTAVLASGAQAIKVTVGSSPAWLTGDQHVTHEFKLANNGPVLDCTTVALHATVKNNDETVTVIPTYSGCTAKVGTETLKATVTMNDCDYLLHGGTEVSSTTFKDIEVDIVCPTGNVIEVHIYKKEPHEAANELCTLTVPSQVNKKGIESHVISGTPNDLTLTLNVANVTVNRDGSLLCGVAANTATYTGASTVKAFKDLGGTVSNGTITGLTEGEQVSLTIS
jgi:hypothetical protein